MSDANRLRELASDLQKLGALGNPLVRVVPDSLCKEIENVLTELAGDREEFVSVSKLT